MRSPAGSRRRTNIWKCWPARESSASTSVDPLRWGFILNTVRSLTGRQFEDLNKRFRVGRSDNRGRNKPAAPVYEDGKPTKQTPAPPLTSRQRAEGFILGLLLLEPARWDQVQQHIGPADFQDSGLRPIADLFWQHQQDEGEPVLNEFLSLMDEAQKGIAIGWVQWVQETSAAAGADAQNALDGSLQQMLEDREREGDRKLMAHLRRTTDSKESVQVDVADDLEALRRLQERSRKPDLKRVAL